MSNIAQLLTEFNRNKETITITAPEGEVRIELRKPSAAEEQAIQEELAQLRHKYEQEEQAEPLYQVRVSEIDREEIESELSFLYRQGLNNRAYLLHLNSEETEEEQKQKEDKWIEEKMAVYKEKLASSDLDTLKTEATDNRRKNAAWMRVIGKSVPMTVMMYCYDPQTGDKIFTEESQLVALTQATYDEICKYVQEFQVRTSARKVKEVAVNPTVAKSGN